MLTDNVSVTLAIDLAQISSRPRESSIFRKLRNSSFVAEQKFSLCSFPTSFIHKAQKKLSGSEFACVPVCNRQLAVCSTYVTIPIDGRTQYENFPLFNITFLCFCYSFRLFLAFFLFLYISFLCLSS